MRDRLASEGKKTPLDVMLDAMWELEAKGEKTLAAGIAKDAAPYCHARLAHIEQTGPGGGPQQHHHVVEQRIVKKHGDDPG